MVGEDGRACGARRRASRCRRSRTRSRRPASRRPQASVMFQGLMSISPATSRSTSASRRAPRRRVGGDLLDLQREVADLHAGPLHDPPGDGGGRRSPLGEALDHPLAASFSSGGRRCGRRRPGDGGGQRAVLRRPPCRRTWPGTCRAWDRPGSRRSPCTCASSRLSPPRTSTSRSPPSRPSELHDATTISSPHLLADRDLLDASSGRTGFAGERRRPRPWASRCRRSGTPAYAPPPSPAAVTSTLAARSGPLDEVGERHFSSTERSCERACNHTSGSASAPGG